MQRVAEYLLEHRWRASESPLTNLSRETGVSKTTIVRFCQELGFEGYKDFYAAWIASLTLYKAAKRRYTGRFFSAFLQRCKKQEVMR
jgi:DNA-binding MurR/RpiR family transcriptional regulator